MADLIIRNARVMTCDPERPGLGILDNAAIVVKGGRIQWVGDDAEVEAGEAIDARGALVTPGLIDCHTHAIFAGDRANEFELRARGASYLEIAAAGGGIASSIAATRAASDAELISLLRDRIRRARDAGTTTIEVKSGYDLTVDGEMRLLRCISEVPVEQGTPRVVPTLLVHVVPPERRDDRPMFMHEMCEVLIPQVAAQALATSVDVYCDQGAFTLDETRQVLAAAQKAGLQVRAHVGQFEDLGGPELLGGLSALSADHLEQVSDAGIEAMARAGTVAVMLPGACVQLRLPVPPVAKLRAAGVHMAIASDLNPGTSFCEQLPLQMWLATTHYGMTVEEAWLGVTRHAAKAVASDAGVIKVGAPGDLVLWKCAEPATVPYRYGAAATLVDRVWVGGATL